MSEKGAQDLIASARQVAEIWPRPERPAPSGDWSEQARGGPASHVAVRQRLGLLQSLPTRPATLVDTEPGVVDRLDVEGLLSDL